jgi:hypothetical protein
LFSFGKSFAFLGTMQYICATGNLYHGKMAQWSAVQCGSAVWRHSADVLELESLSMQIILDQIILDWIGLFCIQIRIWNPWSREGLIQVVFQIKERINPTN